ncbi:hypothetical protein Misp04_41460 [Micromonospora sp. NBRC 101691]|nr:hypothetical protein Misp04_41460 [Micromonospora sp. NBRC 101691]
MPAGGALSAPTDWGMRAIEACTDAETDPVEPHPFDPERNEVGQGNSRRSRPCTVTRSSNPLI